ncbi:tetratricopeptide repeat protein [Desulfobacterales bacterium HSG2]|nr:tetratricopeptide repeat protein [Desulfobacterales bacterium HSG2]
MKKRIFTIIFGVFMVLVWAAGAMANGSSLAEMKRLLKEAFHVANYPEALAKLEKGLEIAKKTENKQAVATFLGNMGNVYGNLDQYDKALRHHEEALAIHKEIGDRRGEGADLTNMGVVYQNLGQYDKALGQHKEALAIRRKIGDRKDEADSMTNIGVVYRNLGQYDKALGYYGRALAIHKEIGDRRGEGADLSNMGVVYRNLGQHDKALEQHEEALAIRRKIGDRKDEADSMTNIGVVYRNLGQYDKALGYYRQALAIQKEIGDRRGEGNNLGNMGMVYQNFGQYDKALGYYGQALAIRKEIGDRKGEGAGLGNMGIVYGKLGRYDKALRHFEQALAIKKEIGDRRGRGNNLTNMGMVFQNLGQYGKALGYFEQALAIHKEIGDRGGEGNNLTNMGLVYGKLGRDDKALRHFEQALAIHKEIGDRGGEGNNLTNMGLVYGKLGRDDKALRHFEQALAIHKEIGDRGGEGSDLTNMGVVYRNLGRYDKALLSFSESQKIFSEIRANDALWKALQGLAQTEGKLGKHEKAVAHYDQSLNAIEAVRSGITEKESKTSFMLDKLFVYDQFIELLQALHKKYPGKDYDKKSLEVFERKQGRIFLEEMGESGAKKFADLPDDIRRKEISSGNELTKIRSQITAEQSRPAKDRDSKHIRSLEAKEMKIRAEADTLQKEIRTEYPEYHALRYPKPVRLPELRQKALRPGEVMLVFGVMKKTTCLWVIGKEVFRFLTIDISEEALREKVNAFRHGPDMILEAYREKAPGFRLEQIYRKSELRMQRAAFTLYNLLLPEKVRPLISRAETLYVIPTSALYGLPFEALATGESDIRYLAEDHAVAYLSSASLLKVLRESQARKKETPRHPFLAFAHPVYQSGKSGTLPSDSSEISRLRTRAYQDFMSKFSDLPETEAEAREIMEILKASAASDPLQLRQKASRSNVFRFNKEKRLDDYRYVLFACHGLIPDDEKMNRILQPALVLSHPDPENREPGFLTMADAFGLSLNADLVALSACNTGRQDTAGNVRKGEGARGLTRAFMYAGTPAVSVTLWSVESESAKVLNTGLFRNLGAGKDRAEALREIRQRMISGKEGELYRHPFFWGPTVIFGLANDDD